MTSGTIFFVCSTKWVSRRSLQQFSSWSDRKAECHVDKRTRSDFQWRFQRRRDPSTWCYAARGARGEILRVNLGNVDEGQGSRTRTRRLVRTTQNPEVERSQVQRQENAQNSNSWKQCDRVESSNSTCTKRLARATFSLEALLGQCVVMEKFLVFVNESSHSSWTESFGEPEGLQEHELRGNPELCQYHTKIDIGAFWRDSECLYDWQCTSSWTRSVLSHDQVIQWTKAKVRVYSDSILCPGKMNGSEGAIERWTGLQNVSLIKNIEGTRWRSNWIRVACVPRIFDIADSSENPGLFAREDHLHVSVQRHLLVKERKWRNWYFEIRTCQGLPEEILARTLDDSGSWRGEEVAWNSSFHTIRKMGFPQPIRWWSDSKTQVMQYSSFSVLCVVEFWTRRMAETPYTSTRMLRTQLLFQIFHSVNQLSIHGALTNWCEQFGLTEEEKGQEKLKESMTKDVLTCVWNHQKYNFWYPSKTSIWKQLARKHSWLRIAGRYNSIHKGLRTCIVQSQYQLAGKI